MSDRRRKYALIHVGLAQLDIGEEKHRSTLCELYAECFQGSSTELTDAHLDDYIEYLKAKGFTPKKPARRRKPRNVTEMIHSGHPMARKIEHLEEDIHWRYRDGARRFARKIIGKDRPATTREAAKLIEALKGLKASQQRKAG